jgi:hypothetical protein
MCPEYVARPQAGGFRLLELLLLLKRGPEIDPGSNAARRHSVDIARARPALMVAMTASVPNSLIRARAFAGAEQPQVQHLGAVGIPQRGEMRHGRSVAVRVGVASDAQPDELEAVEPPALGSNLLANDAQHAAEDLAWAHDPCLVAGRQLNAAGAAGPKALCAANLPRPERDRMGGHARCFGMIRG